MEQLLRFVANFLQSRNLDRLRDDVETRTKRATVAAREHYRRDWGDPVNFHLVLNTGALGFDGATGVIVGRAEAMGWGERRAGVVSGER